MGSSFGNTCSSADWCCSWLDTSWLPSEIAGNDSSSDYSRVFIFINNVVYLSGQSAFQLTCVFRPSSACVPPWLLIFSDLKQKRKFNNERDFHFIPFADVLQKGKLSDRLLFFLFLGLSLLLFLFVRIDAIRQIEAPDSAILNRRFLAALLARVVAPFVCLAPWLRLFYNIFSRNFI